MERKSSRNFTRESRGSMSLERRLAEDRKTSKTEHVPDLTDFMNDMFFGTLSTNKKAYNLTGGGKGEDEDDYDSSVRSNSSRTTQEWLEEARQMVAASPSRCDSPSRRVGSPRFAAAAQGRLSLSSPIERRDPLSRSARRHRAVDSFSGEILTKSVKHSRNGSETSLLDSPPDSPTDRSPAAAVHRWFSQILKVPNPTDPAGTQSQQISPPDQTSHLPPPRQSFRKSRFKNDPNVAPSQGTNIPPRRQFKTSTTSQDTPFLSPPKTLIESSQRRSISSSTCSVPDSINRPLSPPRSLVGSAHRRSISSTTCSLDKISPKGGVVNGNALSREDGEIGDKEESVNGFLEEQRAKIGKLLNEEIDGRAKIVLSGHSNSTSSMVAAICYAWLLQNRICKNKGKEEYRREEQIVVPVMNIRRERMWKQQQAAWLFHHVGVDATSLLFVDEVDLESLMMAGKLSMFVVGQDILKTNGEVGSQCTILTDNYCEEAYDLLQTAALKKLLLAGILLDTQNLNTSAKLTATRDAEAVQLLLVGSAPNYRNSLFDQLMQDSQDSSFYEVLRCNYGKSPTENGLGSGAQAEQRVPGRNSTSIHSEATVKGLDANSKSDRTPKSYKVSPRPDKQSTTPAQVQAQPAADAPKGKNKFFLARWFGFGK